jgi:hypothetical protein
METAGERKPPLRRLEREKRNLDKFSLEKNFTSLERNFTDERKADPFP